MTFFQKRARIRNLIMLSILLSLAGFDNAHGYDSGLSLQLSLVEQNTDFRFNLGEIIGLKMALIRLTSDPIVTNSGFSQVNLHESLILTDPNNRAHAYIPPTRENLAAAGAFPAENIDTMPAPLFLGGRPIIPADLLVDNFARTVTITDIRELFPNVLTIPGWYTIQAHQTFVRFASWLKLDDLNVLALADDRSNFNGTLDSNKIQFYLSPGQGALLSVKVENDGVSPPEPIFQVPVKAFKEEDIPENYSDEDVWDKVVAVLNGTTNTEGVTDWEEDSSCLNRADYRVIARYADDYQVLDIGENEVDQQNASIWGEECEGLVTRLFAFTIQQDEPPAVAGDLDGDGDVDYNDLNIVSSCLGKDPSTDPSCSAADTNGDGVINILDLSTVAGNITSY